MSGQASRGTKVKGRPEKISLFLSLFSLSTWREKEAELQRDLFLFIIWCRFFLFLFGCKVLRKLRCQCNVPNPKLTFGVDDPHVTLATHPDPPGCICLPNVPLPQWPDLSPSLSLQNFPRGSHEALLDFRSDLNSTSYEKGHKFSLLSRNPLPH